MSLKDFFKRYKNPSKKGFTLIEVMAVVCILAITSTATISVFLMVRDTVADTGEVTADQFSTGQIEKFIRNEFQVASKIDIYNRDSSSFLPDSSFTPIDNDECMVFDKDNKCIYFQRYNASESRYKTILTIDGVEDVNISLYPLDTTAANPEGSKYKMVYKIKGDSFTYSGGIVLGNTEVGKDGSLNYYAPGVWNADLTWNMANSAGQNDLVITFHSEVPYSDSSAGSSSGP